MKNQLSIWFCGAIILTGCSMITQVVGSTANVTGALVKGGVKAGAAQLPITDEEELAYGGAIAVMIVQKYGGVDETPALALYVNTVGQALAMYSTRPTLAFHFAVLNSDDVNALSAPGGYVFITRGAVKAMKNEAELAGVLAHEIAHVTAGHAVSILKNLKSKGALADAAADAWKSADMFKGLMNQYLDDYLTKGLPKDTEFEADKLGTQLISHVGWRADGLRSFLHVITQREKAAAKPSALHDTHPDTLERVNKLDAVVAHLPKQGVDLEKRFAANVAGTRAAPAAK